MSKGSDKEIVKEVGEAFNGVLGKGEKVRGEKVRGEMVRGEGVRGEGVCKAL